MRPKFAGSHSRSARRQRFTGMVAGALDRLESRLMPSADVLTYHNDNMRTGLNAAETTLNTANVNAAQFGKLAALPVDGAVYAQPLYKANVEIPGQGVHNVVYIATEHDSLYAFDADTQALLWHDSFIDPAHGLTSVPSSDVHTGDLFPEIGITSTPVIDASTGTIYVADKIKLVAGKKTFYAQQLIALDITTGAFKNGGPTTISAVVPGRGKGSFHGRLTFDPKIELQRTALTLVDGVVYLSWASHSDYGPFHGWIMGYDAQTLKQRSVFNVTPNGSDGGIWMSGAGLAADSANNLFVVTGNGTFDANRGGKNYGDSVLKLSTAGGLTVADSFTPFNQATFNATDLDLGSGGALLLPDQPGLHPHLLVTAGKEGRLYLIDRDALGKFSPKGDQIVEEIPQALAASFDTPAYFNSTIYYVGTAERSEQTDEVLRAFHLTNGVINPTPTVGTIHYRYPGATPSISSNGTTNGIVWTIDSSAFATLGPAILRAYDANDITHELYNSTQNPADAAGPAVKFAPPTIADGKVFVAGFGAVTVYGLKPR
jgi:hypothetical protein